MKCIHRNGDVFWGETDHVYADGSSLHIFLFPRGDAPAFIDRGGDSSWYVRNAHMRSNRTDKRYPTVLYANGLEEQIDE